MATAQELFDDAYEQYEAALELIRGMDQTYQKVMKQTISSFHGWDVRATYQQFDWILQTILLNEALSDGVFHAYEKQFIDKLTDYGDLWIKVKKETRGKTEMNWDKISDLSEQERERLTGVTEKVMEDVCDSFVRPLATVDVAVDTVSLLDELTGYIAKIVADLAAIDGTEEDGEKEAAAAVSTLLLAARWQRFRRMG